MTKPAGIEQGDKGSRIAAVDGLRGMLALVVVVWHIGGPLGASWLLIPADVAVAIFFVLSGYVLTRGWNGRFGVFLARRFVRLWPVYALCLGAGYFIAGIHPVWSEFLWYPLIDANAKPFIDPPIWSLFLEAWAMPFMPLIVWAGSGAIMRAAFCMLALLLAALAVPQLSVGALFVAGAFLARSHYRSRFFESAIPQWFGRISYSLYLTHWLALALATRAYGPWGAIAALPAVFVVAWLVWWGVERPSIWASRRVGRAVAAAIDRLWRSRGATAVPASSREGRALPEIRI
jgi:peptidoglycan/LPS O-acetylase OafA/YrhL